MSDGLKYYFDISDEVKLRLMAQMRSHYDSVNVINGRYTVGIMQYFFQA